MKTLKNIAAAILAAGGQAFFVGGFVRDKFFGKESKDIDIEVFGLDKTAMEAVLSRFGELKWAGNDFPVAKMSIDGLDLDFSLPRRERKVGVGHNDFETQFDPFMSKEEAASRRDFTMNALMQDILTGEILDFFGGISDITNRILRHVSKAFAEDALRVLRGMQFAARFGMTMAEETIQMCKTLKSEFAPITKERLFEEWQKFFCKGVAFDKGLDILLQTTWFDQFDGLFRTNIRIGSEILGHSLQLVSGDEKMVVGIAAMFQGNKLDAKMFMKQINCPNHITRDVLELLTFKEELDKLNRSVQFLTIEQRVRLLVGQHIKFNHMTTVCVFLQVLGHFRSSNVLLDVLRGDIDALKPKVNGNDLMEKGWSQKVHKQLFGQELKRLFELQLMDDLSREELLGQILTPLPDGF